MVNVGIIGAGRIGKVHVESICTQVKDAKVKMLADPFMNDETAKWAKDMGVEAVTKDYKERSGFCTDKLRSRSDRCKLGKSYNSIR